MNYFPFKPKIGILAPTICVLFVISLFIYTVRVGHLIICPTRNALRVGHIHFCPTHAIMHYGWAIQIICPTRNALRVGHFKFCPTRNALRVGQQTLRVGHG